MPTVIGKRGVHNVLYPTLSEDETKALKLSIEKMKKLSDIALSMV
jgi:malate/lactate dehydrogenase